MGYQESGKKEVWKEQKKEKVAWWKRCRGGFSGSLSVGLASESHVQNLEEEFTNGSSLTSISWAQIPFSNLSRCLFNLELFSLREAINKSLLILFRALKVPVKESLPFSLGIFFVPIVCANEQVLK